MSNRKKVSCALALLLSLVLIGALFLAGESRADQHIRLVVNGREVACSPPPFIESDRVYVPVRFVSEALGYPVRWDERTRTVYVGTSSEGIDLVGGMKPQAIYDAYSLESAPVKIGDVIYDHGYVIDYDTDKESKIVWRLDGCFKTFSFLTGYAGYGFGGTIKVYGDGELLGSVSIPVTEGKAAEYTFDVTGVKTLTVEYTYLPGGKCAIINPRAN